MDDVPVPSQARQSAIASFNSKIHRHKIAASLISPSPNLAEYATFPTVVNVFSRRREGSGRREKELEGSRGQEGSVWRRGRGGKRQP